jgi:hypothetical protein
MARTFARRRPPKFHRDGPLPVRRMSRCRQSGRGDAGSSNAVIWTRISKSVIVSMKPTSSHEALSATTSIERFDPPNEAAELSIQALPKPRANANTQDHIGRNALDYALDPDDYEVTLAPLDGGRDVNEQSDTSTPDRLASVHQQGTTAHDSCACHLWKTIEIRGSDHRTSTCQGSRSQCAKLRWLHMWAMAIDPCALNGQTVSTVAAASGNKSFVEP